MPTDLQKGSNTYYAMRHGESEANVAGIIVSDPDIGCRQYGLSALGREQAESSARHFSALSERVLIYSSDFLRARQTADIVQRVIGLSGSPVTTPLLRERFFGDIDGGGDDAYPIVWAHDRQDSLHTEHGVESVQSVAQRGRELIETLAEAHANSQIILVAHGDVLQILQTVFEDENPAQHRQLPHLQVAELRQLN